MMENQMLLTIYVVVATITTIGTWVFSYTMNGGDEKILRALRRDIRMLIPGKTGHQTRVMWTRKQIRKLARRELAGWTFQKDAQIVSYCKIVAKGSYDAYLDDFCLPKKTILFFFGEALLMGIFWFPMLILIITLNFWDASVEVYNRIYKPK